MTPWRALVFFPFLNGNWFLPLAASFSFGDVPDVRKTRTIPAPLSPHAPLVDELGALELELLPFRSKLKRADTLRAALREAYVDLAPEGQFRAAGLKYTALLGPKGNESIVDRAALYILVGGAKYVDLSSVSLRSLEGLQTASVVSVAATGSRPLSVIPNA